ncbi:MAG: transposase [Clostridia bacterium]|nr:transposase [Clostridia bacterium]
MKILNNLPKRKPIRLKNYDYNTQGAYFITICTQNRKEILSNIVVGTGVLDCPKTILSNYGKIAKKYINEISNFYDNLSVDKYVIMPNHIHLLISIIKSENGQSGTPVPTNVNSVVSRFVSTFKRFCNKEYTKNIWQPRFYDHVIRGEQDYKEIWQYIENNPAKWEDDEFYTK